MITVKVWQRHWGKWTGNQSRGWEGRTKGLRDLEAVRFGSANLHNWTLRYTPHPRYRGEEIKGKISWNESWEWCPRGNGQLSHTRSWEELPRKETLRWDRLWSQDTKDQHDISRHGVKSISVPSSSVWHTLLASRTAAHHYLAHNFYRWKIESWSFACLKMVTASMVVTTLIPALGRQRWTELWVQSQSGLHRLTSGHPELHSKGPSQWNKQQK